MTSMSDLPSRPQLMPRRWAINSLICQSVLHSYDRIKNLINEIRIRLDSGTGDEAFFEMRDNRENNIRVPGRSAHEAVIRDDGS